MFHQALEELLETKAFDTISISDIANQATLTRATFYDHYADKFALLEELVSTRFQGLLEKRGVRFDGNCTAAVMGITLAMCDYLAGLPNVDCSTALIAVVRRMILEGLTRHGTPGAIAPEIVAAAASGAMYGAVTEWMRAPTRCPAEEIVPSIYSLLRPMLEGGYAVAAT
jgi:AcrR family transcriptional regulator